MDLVAMLDVLEHISESSVALQEVKRVIKQDVLFLMTVPAFQFLHSPRDKSHNHVKRYCKKDLCVLLNENGFKVLRCSYFNTWLFPIEAAVRLVEKVIGKEISAPSEGSPCVNKILFEILIRKRKSLQIMTSHVD